MDFYEKIKENRRKSVLMVFVSFLLLGTVASVAVAYFGGGFSPTTFVSGAALGIILMSTLYFSSTKMALSLNGAKEVTPQQAPQLHNLVEEMALAAGIPKPKVYIIEERGMNAFATGRSVDKGHIAFTRGLLEVMDREQLQGITAHEMAHIKNEDIKLMTIVAAVASAIVIIADIASNLVWFGGGNRGNNNGAGSNPVILIVALLAVVVLAPIASVMVQSFISRRREALADYSAVEFTRNPIGLQRALETLQSGSTATKKPHGGTAHMWISSPMPVKSKNGKKQNKSFMSGLFATHPPLEDRIEALSRMSGTQSAELQ